MLTLQQLKDMPADTVFASGMEMDSAGGLFMIGSGVMLRWVAVRGGIHDWAIYCHRSEMSTSWICDHGDKVHMDNNIKKLVPCDEEAFAMYRH